MAKNNNFQDFVTDIANAIRIKNSSSELLNPQDFYNKILNIGGYVDYNNVEYLEVTYNVTSTESTPLFYNFTNFTSVSVDGEMVSSISKNYKFSSTGKHYVRYYGMKTIPNNAFYQCESVINVIVPKSVTSIGDYAFYHCTKLENLVMSDSVKTIGNIAFSYCSSLKEVELSSGLTSLGGACFYECTSLKKVTCRATTAPTWGDNTVFYSVSQKGELIHPMNANYSSWMILLNLYNWNETESDFTNNTIFEGSDIIVESIQQFTTHIGNAIRKVKYFDDNLIINPQDYYNLILSINKPFINVKDTVAGDICILVNGEKKFIKSKDLAMYKYYTPIGVVVVPGTHNVYGDNSCSIMSLVSMDVSNPSGGDKRILTADKNTMLIDENGDETSTLIYWGQSNIDNESLRNLKYCLSTTNDSNDTISIKTYTYLPSDIYEGTACYKDNDTYYTSVEYCGVSPYMSDDSRNETYYSTDINENNALAYFNGKENTTILSVLHTIDDLNRTTTVSNNSGFTAAPAAACCYLYNTEGTSKGDWYLPSTAEFGYVIPKLGDIQNSLKEIQNVYDKVYAVQLNINDTSDSKKRYWNSTEYNGEGARAVDVRNGYLINNYKSNTNYVRAFLNVK